MILHFKSKGAEDLYHGINSKDSLKIPHDLWKAARRKLDMLQSAHSLEDLRMLPGNKLEVLKGNLEGRWSIRINDQYRIVFIFEEKNAREVEIVDYH